MTLHNYGKIDTQWVSLCTSALLVTGALVGVVSSARAQGGNAIVNVRGGSVAGAIGNTSFGNTSFGKTQYPSVATASEAIAHARYLREEIEKTVSIKRADYPSDSIRAIIAGYARRSLNDLQGKGRSGLHLNAWGELFALAEQDDSAQAQFAARLRAPNVTLTERGYTYGVAVRVFADYQRPARLPIAERYLAELRALGPRAAARLLEAEYALAFAYYNLSQYDDAARHAVSAIELLSQVPYKYRMGMYEPEEDRYGVILDAVSHTSKDRTSIEKINTLYRAALQVPADSAALDIRFGMAAERAKGNAERMITAHAKVGMKATPLISNYWINTPDTTEHTQRLDDGKIRLLEFGSTGCAPCLWMYSAFQRIYETFPGKVEPIVVAGTNGSWANRLIEPVEESIRLKEWMLTEHKIRFPVVMYRRERIPTDYGDNIEGGDPNYTKGGYIFVGKPTTYLVDGTGTIRRVFVGYSRELEQHMFDAVRHLLAEQAGTVTARTAVLASPSASADSSLPTQP
jgi:hypothetical protein